VLSPMVISKLAFIHERIRAASRGNADETNSDAAPRAVIGRLPSPVAAPRPE
jgi:hypothetical protein